MRRFAPSDTYDITKARSRLLCSGNAPHSPRFSPPFLLPNHQTIANKSSPNPPPQVGRNLRIDGTLKGVNTKSNATVPEWKRGSYSLLFAGGEGEASALLYLNRDKKARYAGWVGEWVGM